MWAAVKSQSEIYLGLGYYYIPEFLLIFDRVTARLFGIGLTAWKPFTHFSSAQKSSEVNTII